MPIPDEAAMTGQGWVVDPMLPPGFYYPTADYPHLHLTCELDPVTQDTAGNWPVAYLGYHEADKRFVIFSKRDGVNDSSMAANLPADGTVVAQAQYAYGLIP